MPRIFPVGRNQRSPVEGTVVYPNHLQGFTHPRWLFGISSQHFELLKVFLSSQAAAGKSSTSVERILRKGGGDHPGRDKFSLFLGYHSSY